MAIRTISATGGNWNSTATWEEGVVPVANDDVFGVTSSGNLVVNVQTATIKSLDMTYYTGTVSGTGRLMYNGGGTNSAGVSHSVEPNIILGGTWVSQPAPSGTYLQSPVFGRDFGNNNASCGIKLSPTFVTASTGLNFLFFNGSAATNIILYSDLWCRSLVCGGNTDRFVMGTYSFYISRQLTGAMYRSAAETPGFSTIKVVGDNIDGGATFSDCNITMTGPGNSGAYFGNGTVEFLTGTYSSGHDATDSSLTGGLLFRPIVAGTGSQTVIFRNGVKFIKTGSGVNDATSNIKEFTINILTAPTNNQQLNIINENSDEIPKINIYDSQHTTQTNRIISASNSLVVGAVEHKYTSAGVIADTTATQSTTTIWQSGLSASTYLTTPIRSVSNTFNRQTTIFNAQSQFASAANILFTSTATHSIGRFITINGERRPTYRTTTGQTTPPYPRIGSADVSKAKIQLGDGGFGYNYSVENVDFLSKTFLSVGDGTITNSTGVTASFASGGGGGGAGGGSFTFVN